VSALHAAVALVCAETTVEVALVLSSGRWTLLGRLVIAACVALQYVFAWRVLHRSAGAVLALMLWQVSALLVAAGADWAAVARLGLAVAAVTTIVLLARGSRTFPEPVLPSAP
jgi:hypothetical protein